MSSGDTKSFLLAQNQQLQTNPDGSARTHWSEIMDFQTAAIYVRMLFFYFSSTTVSVRLLGRRAIDGVTWVLANAGDNSYGYIDGRSSAYDKTNDLGAERTFQYLGDADERGPYFQIGIQVSNSATVEGMVTVSSDASFGPIRVEDVDLTPTSATLTATTNPAIIPGADTIQTYGCSKVRLELDFGAAPGYVVTMFVATGPAKTVLFVDQQTSVTSVNANATSLSMVVDRPDEWCTVYYTVATTTTGSVQRLKIVRLP